MGFCVLLYDVIIIDERGICMMKIPFSPPDMSEAEINEVCDAIRSGWITTGPRTKQFEKNLAEYTGVNKVVCLNSCTAAEELNLRVIGIHEGDEVIVPAYTYTATASAAIHVGATIRMIDSQKDSVEMDYDALEAAINEKTKVIVPVDIAGIPCDYDRLFEIVERKKNLFQPENEIQKAIGRIIICADAAHAVGASWHGKMIGNVADFTAFSFHAVKNLTTAEGGASCWRSIEGIDDDQLYNLYQLYSLHGQNKDALAKTKLGAWEYDIVGPWYKCNMTDIMAAIGLKQLERYPGMLERRRKMIEMYDCAMDDMGIQHLTHYTESYRSSGHLYLIRIPDITVETRNQIITSMAEKGVSTNVHYKPLPMMTAYKNMGFDIKDYPNAYDFYHNEITLPLHTKLTDEEIKYVIDCLKQTLKEVMP